MDILLLDLLIAEPNEPPNKTKSSSIYAGLAHACREMRGMHNAEADDTSERNGEIDSSSVPHMGRYSQIMEVSYKATCWPVDAHALLDAAGGLVKHC